MCRFCVMTLCLFVCVITSAVTVSLKFFIYSYLSGTFSFITAAPHLFLESSFLSV